MKPDAADLVKTKTLIDQNYITQFLKEKMKLLLYYKYNQRART